METLVLVPRGEVAVNKNYGTNVVSFENGNKQFQRKWITPRVTFSFSTQGGIDKLKYLEEFFDSVCGNLYPFYWEYNGTKYVVRFADTALDITHLRGYEGQGVVGFSMKIALEVQKTSEYTTSDSIAPYNEVLT